MKENRDEFLLEVYRQMFNDINRHLSLVWQAVGVLVGALALFALAEKGVISVDIAAALIIGLCGWLAAHVLDSGYWYNRNLAIIANIERQFLLQTDLKDIHYYFGEHRAGNPLMKQLHIQMALGVLLTVIVIIFHLSERVLPGLSSPISHFDPMRALPYLVAGMLSVYLYWFAGNRNASYDEFLKHSPGISVDVSGITYGAGHGRGLSFSDWLTSWFRKRRS